MHEDGVRRLKVRVPGGRDLVVYDIGDPAGPAILYHHGTPSTGCPLPAWEADVRGRGARLIAFDRAGYGESDPASGRSVGDVAADVECVIDALQVGRFVTWGISGGGPHALACAARLGERVAAVATLGGVAPFDAPGLNFLLGMGRENWTEFGLALAGEDHLAPELAAQAVELAGGSPADIIAAMSTLVAEPDRAMLGGPDGVALVTGYKGCFQRGAAGWVDDDLAFVAPWGIVPAQVGCPALVVHGARDRFVPPSHAEWLAEALPTAERWILDDQAHLSLMLLVDRVHDWLLARF